MAALFRHHHHMGHKPTYTCAQPLKVHITPPLSMRDLNHLYFRRPYFPGWTKSAFGRYGALDDQLSAAAEATFLTDREGFFTASLVVMEWKIATCSTSV